jgi:thiol-disulfide isomerase/thioredoxin
MAMNRRQTLTFGAVAAVAAATGAGVGVWRQPEAAEAGLGALPPDFWSMSFTRPEGGELALKAFRGKPLIINFWATWCAPCVRELPEIDRFAAEKAGAGVHTVALAVDGPTPVREFLKRIPVKMPVGLAGLDGSELSRQLGNAQGGLPFTVMVAADGRLAQRRLGETSRDELNRWLDSSKSR